MKRLLRLAAILKGEAPSKNLLNVLAHETPHGIPDSAFANGVIDDPSIGSGNADYVWFSQTFAPGKYVISAKTEGTGMNGVRLIVSEHVTGTSFVSYYNGYVASLTGGYFAFEATGSDGFTIGLILMTNAGHAGEPGKAYDIQLEAGTEPTPYEPYR